MYFSKLLLKSYGKFNNKSIDLDKGINLIYGGPESGKTTVSDFIAGIMFGASKKTGIGINEDSYARRKPYGGNEYSGVAYVKSGNDHYFIEKDFLAADKQTSVLDVNTGLEVRLPNKDTLTGRVISSDKMSYEGKMRIEGLSGENELDKADNLNRYIRRIIETGTTCIDKADAIEYLNSEKKRNSSRPLVRRMDELTKQIEEYDDVDPGLEDVEERLKQANDDFLAEAAKYKRVSRKVVENPDGSITYIADEALEEKIDKLTGQDKLKEKEEDKKEKKLTDRLWFILLVGLLVVGAVTGVAFLIPFDAFVKRIFILFTAIFVIFIIVDDLRLKGFFSDDDPDELPSEEEFNQVLEELKEEHERQEEIEFDLTFAKEYQGKKDALLKEQEVLLKRRQERTHLKAEFNEVFRKKQLQDVENRAIKLAISNIEKVSEEIRAESVSVIEQHAAEFISSIFGGGYSGIRIRDYGIEVEVGGSSYAISAMPEEDLTKLYIALRLTIARYLTGEQLPLIFDDPFGPLGTSDVILIINAAVKAGFEQIIVLSSDPELEGEIRGFNLEHTYTEL